MAGEASDAKMAETLRADIAAALAPRKIVWMLGAGFSKPLNVPLTKELFELRQLRLAAQFAKKAIAARAAFVFLHQVCNGSKSDHKFEPRDYLGVMTSLEAAREFLEPLDRRLAARFEHLHSDLDAGGLDGVRRAVERGEVPAVTRSHATATADTDLLNVLTETRRVADDLDLAITALSKMVSANPTVGVEQLLWQLERAARGESEAMEATTAVVGADLAPEALYMATKRLIVGQIEYACSLSQAARWAPYTSWARRLHTADDTIVSFNYDRVVEIAFDKARVRPAERLLKLHGGLRHQDVDGHMLWLRGYPGGVEPEIGLPGDEKDRVADAERWERAELALQAADAVVILGYSFPPDDIRSVQLLVDGLALNVEKAEQMPLRVVLGNDLGNVGRLYSLVRRKGYAPASTPSFTAESLLSWDRTDVLKL